MGIVHGGPAETITDEGSKIRDATRGYRQVVGGSDVVLLGTRVAHL